MGLFSEPDPDKLIEKRDVKGLAKLLLSSKDDWVRRAAAEALEEIGDPRSADALRRAIDDADDSVTASAASGFVKVAGADAWPALATWWSAQHDTNKRVFVASAVAESEDPAATDLLLTMAAHAWEGVRSTAAEGLGRLAANGRVSPERRERVVQTLCAALADEAAPVRLTAAEALRPLREPTAFEPLFAAMALPTTTEWKSKEAAEAVRAALGALDPPSGEQLLELLMGSAERRRLAVGWLRRDPRPDDPATGAWYRALTGDWAGADPLHVPGGEAALKTLLADGDYAREVALGLSSAGESAVPILESALTGATWLGESALRALCAIGSPRARAAAAAGYNRIVTNLGPDYSDTCRAAMVRMGGAEALQALTAELTCDHPARRAQAAEALGELADPSALPALQAALEDAYTQTIITAAAPDQYTDDFVREAMQRTADIHPVRDAALKAIARLGGAPTQA